MPEAAIDSTGKPQKTAVFAIDDNENYSLWRAAKLENYPTKRDELIVKVNDLANPTSDEISQITRLIQKANMAIYDSRVPVKEEVLEKFCSRFGLKTMEKHRSRDSLGVVSIEPADSDTRGGYIPYTDKPLSWHTDGYYNDPEHRIRAMILHCARNAEEGGVNALIDPEIVYIRMRDENPDYIRAFMHPQCYTIPENTDPRTPYRPVSIGPVFAVDPKTGKLHMRYSARGRNVIWRDDETTRKAHAFLTHILENDPFVIHYKLQSGQGVISNNVLHNRTGFADTAPAGQKRLMYRIRYMERIAQT